MSVGSNFFKLQLIQPFKECIKSFTDGHFCVLIYSASKYLIKYKNLVVLDGSETSDELVNSILMTSETCPLNEKLLISQATIIHILFHCFLLSLCKWHIIDGYPFTVTRKEEKIFYMILQYKNFRVRPSIRALLIEQCSVRTMLF